jgi:hypothetical protein
LKLSFLYLRRVALPILLLGLIGCPAPKPDSGPSNAKVKIAFIGRSATDDREEYALYIWDDVAGLRVRRDLPWKVSGLRDDYRYFIAPFGWMKQGEYLVLQSDYYGGAGPIYTLQDQADSVPQSISRDPAEDARAHWITPDGKKLLYSQRGVIYLVDPEASVREVWEHACRERGALSPDMSRVAYTRPMRGQPGVYITNMDEALLQKALPDIEARDIAWSPDGVWLAVSALQPPTQSSPSPSRQIDGPLWIVQSGGVQRQLALSHVASRPWWSPDSKRVLAVASDLPQKSLIVIEVKTGKKLRLTQPLNLPETSNPWIAENRFVGIQNGKLYEATVENNAISLREFALLKEGGSPAVEISHIACWHSGK